MKRDRMVLYAPEGDVEDDEEDEEEVVDEAAREDACSATRRSCASRFRWLASTPLLAGLPETRLPYLRRQQTLRPRCV